MSSEHYDYDDWNSGNGRKRGALSGGRSRGGLRLTKKKWFYRSEKHLWALVGCFAFWIIFSLGIHLLKKESLLFSLCLAGFILILLLLVCLKHYLLWNHQVKRYVRKCGYTLEDAKDEAWESTLFGRFGYWN